MSFLNPNSPFPLLRVVLRYSLLTLLLANLTGNVLLANMSNYDRMSEQILFHIKNVSKYQF